MKTFQLPVIRNRTFTNENVIIDGTRYENCRFIDCVMVYSGGPGECSSCFVAPGTTWLLQDTAAMTLQTLQMYGWDIRFGAEGKEKPQAVRPN